MDGEPPPDRQETATDSDRGKILEFIAKDREEDRPLLALASEGAKLQREHRLLLPETITDESRSLGECLTTLRYVTQENRRTVGNRAGLSREFLAYLENGMVDPTRITEEEWRKIALGYEIDEIEKLKKIAGIESGKDNVIRPGFGE